LGNTDYFAVFPTPTTTSSLTATASSLTPGGVQSLTPGTVRRRRRFQLERFVVSRPAAGQRLIAQIRSTDHISATPRAGLGINFGRQSTRQQFFWENPVQPQVDVSVEL
jgi:hypothetical protein